MNHLIATKGLNAARAIPRGWIVLGLALGAWAATAFVVWAASALFQFILASI